MTVFHFHRHELDVIKGRAIVGPCSVCGKEWSDTDAESAQERGEFTAFISSHSPGDPLAYEYQRPMLEALESGATRVALRWAGKALAADPEASE